MRSDELITIGAIILFTAVFAWSVFSSCEASGSRGPEPRTVSVGPPDCSQFYNNGHSAEWQKCMGVELK